MTKPRFGLPEKIRLKKNSDFEHIYETKRAKGDQNLLVFAAPNDLGYTRFGVSVSRKLGNAVRRARYKRCLREAFRLSQAELPTNFDLILIPRRGTTPETKAFRKSLVKLTQKLERLLGHKPVKPAENQPAPPQHKPENRKTS